MKTKFLFLIITLGLILLILYFGFSQSSTCDPAECNKKDGWYCNGNITEYRDYYCNPTGSCVYTVTQSKNCKDYNGWYCKDSKNKVYRDYYCSGGKCEYVNLTESYCGDSTDSDNGDNPTTAGKVTIKYCSDGCKSYSVDDYCYGTCSREHLREYYINSAQDTQESYKDYTNLFSQGKYCKNNAIYTDNNKPTASFSYSSTFSFSSSGWINYNVNEELNCNDNDESGCYKYYYNVERVL